jgi:hypothetical protein
MVFYTSSFNTVVKEIPNKQNQTLLRMNNGFLPSGYNEVAQPKQWSTLSDEIIKILSPSPSGATDGLHTYRHRSSYSQAHK